MSCSPKRNEIHGLVKFMDWHRGVGGGGAIDLVMHSRGLGFKDAVLWLQQRFSVATPTTRLLPDPSGSPLRLPARKDEDPCRVRNYLVWQRGLPTSALEPFFARGLLYASKRANAVFLMLGRHSQPVGAELRGTSAKAWRGLAPGSRKDLGYFSVDLSAPSAFANRPLMPWVVSSSINNAPASQPPAPGRVPPGWATCFAKGCLSIAVSIPIPIPPARPWPRP